MKIAFQHLARWRFLMFWHVFFAFSAFSAFAQRGLTELPVPDPVQESASMQVDDQARVNLYAADPDIRKPIQMNFDASGALWVATSEIYPQISPGEVADDKIVVLRDTNGDGICDKATTFAEGLLIPTGVVPDGLNACYVADSTQLLHLVDTDGDGHADEKRVVFSGFGTEDTHHLLHTLRWGPDGCLYFNQSIYIHSHIDTAYGTRHLDGGGIWRYRPSTGSLEVFCKGFINPWGHIFNQLGESFVTDGAFSEGINFAFPDAVFVTSPGATRWLHGLNPGSPKHCGLTILSGDHIPPSWRGQLITNDFRSHKVCRFEVKPSGSGFQSHQQPEVITTSHAAFRPIDAAMGPDGALYIADWYNPIIQHGEVDFRDERRDRKHGRIWRVSFPGRELDRWPDFAAMKDLELFHSLESPSLEVQQFAREELWRRSRVNAELPKTMRHWREQANTVDLRARRSLEVLWMNEVTNQFNGDDAQIAMETSINQASHATVIRSVWRGLATLPQDDSTRQGFATAILNLCSSEDARVRLEAVICAGQSPSTEALVAVANAADMAADANLDFATWQSFRKIDEADKTLFKTIPWHRHQPGLAVAVEAIGTPRVAQSALDLLLREDINQSAVEQLIRAVSKAGDTEQLAKLLTFITASPPSTMTATWLTYLTNRTKSNGAVPVNATEAISSAIKRIDSASRVRAWCNAVCNAAALWKVHGVEAELVRLLESSNDETRTAIIGAIGAMESPEAKKTLDELLNSNDVPTRLAAVRGMLAIRPTEAIPFLMNLLDSEETLQPVAEMLSDLAKQKDFPGRIAAEIEKRSLSPQIASNLLRQIRSRGGNAQIETAIQKSGTVAGSSWKWSETLSQKLVSEMKRHGSPVEGERIYRRNELKCIECHAIGNAGGLIGPNLISIGGSAQPDYIIESLLAPSVKLKEGFTTTNFLTDDGRVISGIVVSKDEKIVQVRLADGSITSILAESIEEESPGKSLMPEGIVDNLSEKELIDLATFLSVLGREPAYSVSTDRIVRSVGTLIYSDETNRQLNRNSLDIVASDNSLMKWRDLTSWVDGKFRLAEMNYFKQHQSTPTVSFVKFQVTLNQPGTLGIKSNPASFEAWLDSKPTSMEQLHDGSTAAGMHEIVLAINQDAQGDVLEIRLDGDAVEAK